MSDTGIGIVISGDNQSPPRDTQTVYGQVMRSQYDQMTCSQHAELAWFSIADTFESLCVYILAYLHLIF